MGFAVHRPGNPVASPRSHRMPCGDVPGRVAAQHRFLGGRGKQPVAGHVNTLANATDISGEVERRFLPAKAEVWSPRS
jgi:hypothetical protein